MPAPHHEDQRMGYRPQGTGARRHRPCRATCPTAAAPAAAERNLPGTTVFSESQARTHVEQRGYTRLRRMSKNADGLWTGTGNKGGTLGTFTIERAGNVNFTPS